MEQSDEFSIPYLLSLDIHQAKQQLLTYFNDTKSPLDPTIQRTIDLLSATCSSVWLTALPIWEQSFYLNKQEFRDALCLRYGLQLSIMFLITVFVGHHSVLIILPPVLIILLAWWAYFYSP